MNGICKSEEGPFFKYTTAEVARIVLETGCLRWSSPIKFNDPFDVTREMAAGIQPSDIQIHMLDEIAAIIESNDPIPGNLSPTVRILAELARQPGPLHVKQAIIQALSETRNDPIQRSQGLEELRSMWSTMTSDMRILCLCEDNDNAAMWHHYGDEYRGVVLEFSCSEELDSAWNMAKPVMYQDASPLFNAKGWARTLLLDRAAAVKCINDESVYTKTMVWAYEKEWRVQSSKRQGEGEFYSYWRFHEDECVRIFLGPRMNEVDRQQIIALRDRLYPKADIREGRLDMTQRRIAFR